MVQLADVPDGHDDVSYATEPGRLFLWFPVGLALKKVRRYLRQAQHAFTATSSGALAIDAPDGYPDHLVLDLATLLTEHESADTRCVFKPGLDDLEVDDIRRVRTIDELRRRRASTWLVDMLRGERLMSVFQPIVRADETSSVFGHEALLRGIDHEGRTVSPGPLFEAARGCGMLPELDCAARRTAIRAIAGQDDRRQLFLNFTPEVVRDGVHTLTRTIEAVDAAEIPRERVIFEVIEAEQAADLRQLRAVVDSVRDAGFRVALDDVGCNENARRLVHAVRPDFVKLDMERIRASSLPQLDGAERLMDLAQQLKVETIAEGVETGAELEWNRDRGATYVQGYFIARPAALSR